jgi:radical SAM protein with 4Fe4S-binding SPASM domain
MSDSPPDDVLSWENLIYLADFLKVSGEERFPILGGEPTMHPDFNDMVLYLLERDFKVTVFTSGVIRDRMLDEAAQMFGHVDPERLSFVCNLNDPQNTHTPLAELESIKRFLGHFGSRIIPGFNIYRTDFELEFLFHYINAFGLNRHIRLGLAHPIVGKKNQYISTNAIGTAIEHLFSYAPLFERLRIKPGLDCGFPLCRFSDDQLGWIYRHAGGKYDFGCGPVIDIGPDMTVWSCFPLSGFQKKSIFEFNSLKEILDHYSGLIDKVHTEVGGIFEECDGCTFREDGLCSGGCLAHSLSRFQNEAPVRMEELYL